MNVFKKRYKYKKLSIYISNLENNFKENEVKKLAKILTNSN